MSDEIKNLSNLDRVIHEPSRLSIVAVLSACESADFNYLLNATELTKGNLSAQLSKLADAGYVDIQKGFKGKYPHTVCRLTGTGRQAFDQYMHHYRALARRVTGAEG